MWKNCLILSIVLLIVPTLLYSQSTFTPRSGAEVQAWRFYKQYKESKANEARLKSAIRQGKGDFSDISGSSIGGLAGIITGDATDLANLRKELAIELALQDSLLTIWEKTFFWRYGDLRDIERPPVRDAKTGRRMDPIEFAITYSPFYRDVVTKAAGATSTAE